MQATVYYFASSAKSKTCDTILYILSINNYLLVIACNLHLLPVRLIITDENRKAARYS